MAVDLSSFLNRSAIEQQLPAIVFSNGHNVYARHSRLQEALSRAYDPTFRSLVTAYDHNQGFGTWNWGRYSNPQMDALLEQGLATVDNPRRAKLLQQATDLVINDYGIIPLHYQVNTWAARKGLTYTPRTDERTYAHEVRQAP